jgi:hypothetical protein
VTIGGYRLALHASAAGRFACDSCLTCGRRPAEGETVWFTCYGDLFCDGCSS